jgi:hypothetical protein
MLLCGKSDCRIAGSTLISLFRELEHFQVSSIGSLASKEV